MIRSLWVWIKRLLLLVWLLVLVWASIKFYLDNRVEVAITLWRWTIDGFNLASVIYALMVMSMLLTLLALLPWAMVMRVKLRRTEKRLKESRAALDAVSNSPQ